MRKISENLKLILSFTMIIGFVISYAQETKPDTIYLTTEEIIESKSVVWDTIIIVTPENKDAVNDYLHKNHKGIHIVTSHKGGSEIHAKAVSAAVKKMGMYFDNDVKVDGKSKILTYTVKGDELDKHDGRIKIITEKLKRNSEGEDEIEIIIESDEGGAYDVIWVGDSTEREMKHKIWLSKDGKDKKYEFVVLDGKEGLFNVHELKDSLKKVLIEITDDDGNLKMKSKKISYAFVSSGDESFTIDSLHEHLDVVEELKVVSEDDAKVFVIHDGNKKTEFKVKIDSDIKNIDKNVIVYSSDDKKHKKVHFGDKFVQSVDVEFSNEVSDEELEELGIKAKSQELKAENLWMYYVDDKELRLKFRLDSEGKTTIKVLDAKGKDLFTDKVVYFPGTYDKKITLDAKHSSPIYIYIEQGNASTIKKLSMN